MKQPTTMEPSEIMRVNVSLVTTVVPLKGEIRQALAEGWREKTGWIVGHADDGVLWGTIVDGTIRMAVDFNVADATPLRGETLLDLRIFNHGAELRCFRDGGEITGVLVREKTYPNGEPAEFYATQQMEYALLQAESSNVGSFPDAESNPFGILRGRGGQLHTPPLVDGRLPTHLSVRHYFERLENGLLRMAEHRLLDLTTRTGDP
ncbi:MAG: hypothetical protein IPK82_06965 [Polyangiaceae bacterium]|nr:hypothetical protein [Polyangiaceae bacterium]